MVAGCGDEKVAVSMFGDVYLFVVLCGHEVLCLIFMSYLPSDSASIVRYLFNVSMQEWVFGLMRDGRIKTCGFALWRLLEHGVHI